MKTLLLKNLMPAPWAWLGLILFFALGRCEAQTQKNLKSVRGKQFCAFITLASGEQVKGRIGSVGDSSFQMFKNDLISDVTHFVMSLCLSDLVAKENRQIEPQWHKDTKFHKGKFIYIQFLRNTT